MRRVALPSSPTTQRFTSLTTREMPLGAIARNARRSAPRDQPGAAQYEQRIDGYLRPIRCLDNLVVGPRTLIITLVLLALLPNVIIAAFVSAIGTQPAASEVKSTVRGDAVGADDSRPRQAAKSPPILTAPSLLDANARG